MPLRGVLNVSRTIFSPYLDYLVTTLCVETSPVPLRGVLNVSRTISLESRLTLFTFRSVQTTRSSTNLYNRCTC